ncbi:transmembrane protein 144-like [Branchiostoma lanceolatum]|uniref:transmembrane protein 144-like n=1 Tax=Branchiostoma lanceolatum TaxID=7740 RepID=UPI0034524C58
MAGQEWHRMLARTLYIGLVLYAFVAACDCGYVRNEEDTPTTLYQDNATTESSTTVVPASLTPSNTTKDETYLGFIAAAVSVVFFGSNLVPIKKVDTGDGMFFQWVFCSAIWCVGLVVNVIQGYPKFYPISMLGGFLWCTGNATVVPILKCIGMGMGMLIWGSFNLMMGWFSGRFGWFGLKPQDKFTRPPLNYTGFGLAVLSVAMFLFVKSEGKRTPSPEEQRLLVSKETLNSRYGTSSAAAVEESDDSWVDRLSSNQKRLVGILLSACAGCAYGTSFAPVIYAQEHYTGASQNGLDYVFAHFSGIYATSTLYFILYAMYMKNKPKVFPRAILPTLLSGLMWGIAESGWFVANQKLQESVSFPIISTGPGMIAALWSIFYFKEIKGARNLLILGLAFAVTVAGALLTAFSY